MNRLPTQFPNGGEGLLISMVGEQALFVSSIAFPPGGRPEATVELAAEPSGRIVLRLKVSGSQKQPDGTFHVRARLVDLHRQDRERLEHALASG